MDSLSITEGRYFEYLIYYIGQVKYWKYTDYPKIISDKIHDLFKNSSINKNILFTCANPTKIIILVIEMLDLIKKKSIYNKS